MRNSGALIKIKMVFQKKIKNKNGKQNFKKGNEEILRNSEVDSGEPVSNNTISCS